MKQSFEILDCEFDNYSQSFIDQISIMHIDNLPNSRYAILGLSAVKIFYKILLESNEVKCFYLKDKKDKIGGFIFASPISFNFKKLIIRNFFKQNLFDIINIIGKFIFYIVPKIKLNKNVICNSENIEYSECIPIINSANVISIIVDKQFKGKGYGSILINKIIEYYTSKCYLYLIAQTTSLQQDAINFYFSLDNFVLFEKKKSLFFNFENYSFKKKLNEIL